MCRSHVHIFWYRVDTRTGFSSFLKRLHASLNGRFIFFNLSHVIKDPSICILIQADEKSGQPGIRGLGHPLIFLSI